MSWSAEIKLRWVTLFFAWPAVVGTGWIVGQFTHTHWPIPALTMAWLGVLFHTLRRAAATGD